MRRRFVRTSQWSNSQFYRYLGLAATLWWVTFPVALLLGANDVAYCDTFTINFDTLPGLPVEPSNFFEGGPEQTYSQVGLFTISGGVALGNPVGLPAFMGNGSLQNLYGTANLADPSLSPTIRLDLPTTAFHFTSVSFLLFNGQPNSENYIVFGMAGGVVLDPLPIGPLASASASGFTAVTLTLPFPITTLNITTPNASLNGWDFFIDDIVLNGTAVSAVPEPSSLILLIAPIWCLAFTCYRRWRSNCVLTSVDLKTR